MRGSVKLFTEVLTGSKVFNEDGELFGPAGIDRICQQPVIGAHLHHADSEVIQAFGQWILVQQDFFGPVLTQLLPAVDRILTSCLSPAVVQVVVPVLGTERSVSLIRRRIS